MSTISLPVVSKELKELPSTQSQGVFPSQYHCQLNLSSGIEAQVTQGNPSFLIGGSSDLRPAFSPQETAIPSMPSPLYPGWTLPPA